MSVFFSGTASAPHREVATASKATTPISRHGRIAIGCVSLFRWGEPACPEKTSRGPETNVRQTRMRPRPKVKLRTGLELKTRRLDCQQESGNWWRRGGGEFAGVGVRSK